MIYIAYSYKQQYDKKFYFVRMLIVTCAHTSEWNRLSFHGRLFVHFSDR